MPPSTSSTVPWTNAAAWPLQAALDHALVALTTAAVDGPGTAAAGGGRRPRA